MIEDILTIRAESKQQSSSRESLECVELKAKLWAASIRICSCRILFSEDRDRYYYGVDDIFRLQSSKMKTPRVEWDSSRIDEAH
jgi:hypothetical protein